MKKEFWGHGRPALMHGIMIGLSLAGLLSALAADPTVSVTAQQRYPWNGMVDVAFTITGESGTKYDTSFVARDVAGGTNLTMKTIYKSDGSAAALTNQLAAGSYKWVWNAAADLPNGFNCERVVISGNVIKVLDINNATYMVIDLSAGSSATSYPITYMNAIPGGKWSDEYKTTKLVLRRIQSSPQYYMGIFEVTQRQYELINGNRPSYFSGDTLPVEQVSYNNLRGSSKGSQYPNSTLVDDTSVMGKLRLRTGLHFDLPSESQWEAAYQAGASTGVDPSTSNAWYERNADSQTHIVGTKAANSWGFYDMLGNVKEWCLEWYDQGAGSRLMHGGSYDTVWQYCKYYFQHHDSAGRCFKENGFRVCLTVE